MDKRLLTFVVSLSLSLFLVNMYFQKQHDEALRVWNEQNKVKTELVTKIPEPEAANSLGCN